MDAQWANLTYKHPTPCFTESHEMHWLDRWIMGMTRNEKIDNIIRRSDLIRDTQGAAPALAYLRAETLKLKTKPRKK
jgi:hypothetical protein